MIVELPPRRKPFVQLTPLIDVTFNILTFFIVFTVFRGAESGIPLKLPKSVTAQKQAAAPVVVTVSQEGDFFVNGARFTREALAGEIARTVRTSPDQVVIIKADRDARYEYLVEALDAVRGSAGARIALAVDPAKARDAAATGTATD
ncbi:MAG: ExbD/TolR family protein [Chitinophagales bacterium]